MNGISWISVIISVSILVAVADSDSSSKSNDNLKSNNNNNAKDGNSKSSRENGEFLAKREQRSFAEIQRMDPFSSPPVSEQLNCDKVGLDCPQADCQWLDWYVEYNRTIVNATALEEITFNGTDRENIGARCFARCQNRGSNCTAYTFNQANGICRTFGVYSITQISRSPGWTLGLRSWPTPTVLGEWVATRDVRPVNPPYRQLTLDRATATWMTCLDLCAQDSGVDMPVNSSARPPSNQCIVAVFDLDSKNCSLHDNFSTRRHVVQPHLVTLQHYSSFHFSNSFRFYDMGNVAPVIPQTGAINSSLSNLTYTIDAEDLDTCFDLCLYDKWNCVLVTATSTGTSAISCTLYYFIPDEFEVGLDRNEPPGESDPNQHYQIKSYLLTYPENYNTMNRVPYFFQIQGTPLYQFEASNGLNECWGRALDFLKGRTPWWWLAYNSTSHLCSLYPEQISGVNIDPSRNSPQGPLFTFSNRRPVLSSANFYAFDTFWISPTELNGGQVVGQNQGQLSLENCLARCVNSTSCVGVARTPRENNCILLEREGMDSILNRTIAAAPILYTMEIFEKTRDLRALDDTRSTFTCHPRPYLDQVFSTVNRSNPFVSEDRVDSFRKSLPLNKEGDWLEPHGANFNGSLKYFSSPSQGESGIQLDGSLSLSSLPPFGRLRAGPGGSGSVRHPFIVPPAVNIPNIGDNVDLPGRRVGQPRPEMDWCATNPTDCGTIQIRGNCHDRCPQRPTGPAGDLRTFLRIIKGYVSGCFGNKEKSSRQHANPNNPAENNENTCKCWNQPEPVPGLGTISPVDRILQEDCRGRDVGQQCTICCKQAFAPVQNPRCRCSAGLATEWDIEQPVCRPINQCVSGRTTLGGQNLIKLHMRNCNTYLYFFTAFNTGRKIPFFGVSSWSNLHRLRKEEQERTGRVIIRSSGFVTYPCTETITTTQGLNVPVSRNQLNQGFYDDLNANLRAQNITFSRWIHGHVVAWADSALFDDGGRSTMRRVNVAPQDGKANRAWSDVENNVRNLLNEQVEGMEPRMRGGYIVTGTCWSADPGNNIPDCFWKIVCTRILNANGQAAWRVGAFYHMNAISRNQEMVNERKREMYQVRQQEELVVHGFFGPLSLDSLWDDIALSYNPLIQPIELLDQNNALQCKNAPSSGFPNINWPAVPPPGQGVNEPELPAEDTTQRDELRSDSESELEGDDLTDLADLFDLKAQIKPSAHTNIDIDLPLDTNINIDLKKPTKQQQQGTTTPNRTLFRFEPDVSLQSQLGAPPICGKKVVGFVTAWSDVPFNSSASNYLTHAVFTYVEMQENGTLRIGALSTRKPNQTSDSNSAPDPATVALETRKAYVRLYEIKLAKKQSGGRLRTMFSVGGWDNSQYFSRVIADPILTQNFIRSVNELLDYWDMDGIDIDFEYPVTGGPTPGSTADKENFVQFLNKVRYGLIDHGVDMGRNISRPYLLTISGPLGAWILDPGFDLPKIAGIVDWINVMSYDYYGPWDPVYGEKTGPIAPLFYGAPPNSNYSHQLTVDFTLKYYSCHVGDNSKLVLGVGFYGRYWNNSGSPYDPSDPLWRNAIRNAQGTFDGGFLPYSVIRRDFRSPIYKKTFNQKTQTPYMLSNGTNATNSTSQPIFFMAYENQYSIIQKVFYAGTKNFGGISIRSVDYDDPSHTLLRTASSNVLCSWGPTPSYKCPPTTIED